MAPTGTSQGISRPPFKPPTQEVISIDSDSDSNAPGPRRPSASKVAVQPGTYANAPKFASAYVQSPHFATPQTSVPQVAYSIESSNGNPYIKTSNANVVGSVDGAAQQPTERQLEKMPAITMDVNEVFENQSVTTTADHLERGTLVGDSDGENEDDEKTLFDESFPEIGDDALLNSDDPEMCTLQEARHYRNLLRELGPRQFVAQTVENDTISAKKLITAFGCASPSWMVGAEDIQYYPYLQWALIRELNKRTKIDELNTVDDAARLLRKSKNVIVLTGAGISTSLGIPDFRSKDIGLYAKLEHLGLADPQEVFDIELFREDPSIFYSVAKDIIPDHKRFTPTHAFIKLLQDKGKLLTNYSQNIDNIEGVAGVKPEKLIQCHGSFATASCTKCGAKVPGASIFKEIRDGVIPRCKRCIQNLKPSEVDGRKRKRSKNRSDSKKKSRKSKDFEDSSEEEEGAYDLPVAGVMKPDITFFGEALPDTFHERLTKHDRPLVDLVIVIGTSLKVAPVSEVVDFLDRVPTIYISREPVKHIYFDIDLLGDCDIVVAELCRRAGWALDHEMIPQGQKISVTGDPNFPSRWTFKQTFPAPKGKEEEWKEEREEELNKEMVDGRIAKVKKERKLPGRTKGCESPDVKKGKQKKLQTWMEDGREVTGVYKGIKREKKNSTWMENGCEVTGEFQVKDSDSD